MSLVKPSHFYSHWHRLAERLRAISLLRREPQAGTVARPEQIEEPSYGTESLLIGMEGLEALKEFQVRPIVPERGLQVEPPFDTYINNQGWQEFVNARQYLLEGDRVLLCEFYANFSVTGKDKVMVRGKTLDISARAINAFYKLKNIPQDEYSKFINSAYNVREITKELTGVPRDLESYWKALKKKLFTPQAKLWNAFVSARIMPTYVNSEVAKKRALLVYAILKGMTIDVGKIINYELHAATNARSKTQSIGFPSLIRHMCMKAHILGERDPSELVPHKATLKLSDFIAATAQQTKRQRSEEDNDDESGPCQEEQAPNPYEERFAGLESKVGELRSTSMYLKEGINGLQDQMGDFIRYQVAFNEYLARAQSSSDFPTYPMPRPLPPPPTPPPS